MFFLILQKNRIQIELLADKSTVCNTENVDGSSMKIVVNFKKKLELCSREMIQQFNIIFKRIFNVLKFKMHNRNFYDPESAEAIKQHNLSIWPGNDCIITKGQLISKRIFVLWNFPKFDPKNLKDFCPDI